MTEANRDLVQDIVSFDDALDHAEEWLLYDPQTSGGLLICVHPDDAETLLSQLHEAGLEHARLIGEIDATGGPSIRVVKQ